MIRVAVVDDEEIILEAICAAISDVMNRHNADFEMNSFSDGRSLLKSNAEKRYDLVFLDIDMPGLTGVDIAQKLRNYESSMEIIFVTNKEEMVYETIKYVPFRFIRKSRFETEIGEAVENYFRKKEKQRKTFMVSTDNGKKTLSVQDVVFIEVKSHKLTININNSKSLEANGTLKDVEARIAEYGFIRIHQSYLVNFRYIDVIKQKGVVLDDGSILPLGRGRYENVKIALMRFSREMCL